MQTTTSRHPPAGAARVPVGRVASLRFLSVLLALSGPALLSACGSPKPGPWVEGDGYRWRELAVSGGEAGFDLVSPDHTGVSFQNRVSPERRLQNQLLTHGSGVAIGDVDGDGLPDVYLARVDGPDALYRNLGDWRFEDITDSAGVALPDHDATGAVMADVDGDEDLDLYVGARGQPNALFLNDGAGHFTDVSSAAGVDYPGGTTTLTMADVDGDGDLDLYVANYKTVKAGNVFSPHERAFDQVVEKRGDDYMVADRYKDFYRLRFTPEGMTLWQFGEPDVLYLNDGSGTFTPASWTDGRFLKEDGAPLDSIPDEWALTARFYDVDGDRAPDLYVSNDFESPDHFWMNQGDGTFRSVDGFEVRNTSASSMAVDFSDINRDGRTDFFVVDMFAKDPNRRRTQIPTIAPEVLAPGEAEPRLQHNRNTLFVARPDGTFEETAWAAGIEASGWSWSTLFMDVDLDGYEDALVTTGHVWDVLDADTQSRLLNTVMSEDWQEVIDEFPPLPLGNAAFRNKGDGTFEDAAQRWGFDLGPDISHGFATGDLDLDGDEDVVVNRLGYPAAFLKNHSAAPRIAVHLRGLAPNTHGIGANVRLLAPDFRQDKEIAAGGLYLSSSQAEATFAVPAEGPLSLVVDWRSGRTSVISDVQANRLYEIDERGAHGRSRSGGCEAPAGAAGCAGSALLGRVGRAGAHARRATLQRLRSPTVVTVPPEPDGARRVVDRHRCRRRSRPGRDLGRRWAHGAVPQSGRILRARRRRPRCRYLRSDHRAASPG